ncbi:MAG: hypothetical protein ACYCZR_13510 [Burkholderiales bacterium]
MLSGIYYGNSSGIQHSSPSWREVREGYRDPQPGWVYVASEAGIVPVFKIQGSMVIRIDEGLMGPNAHVVAVDPATHWSYFPLRNLNGKTALHIMKNRP